ncbi:FxSxx-COOH system tetratricopeptide repeat protein [Kitasatospora sp. NPDC088346]|uniref:FxSxx-COOH system tetratricopeptide repeat protein n=1 Tax=Kitasatospora sp. NPDC088346 TaxID=3364073 RepID=UPI0037F6323D
MVAASIRDIHFHAGTAPSAGPAVDATPVVRRPVHFKAPPRHPSFTGRQQVLEEVRRRLGSGFAAVLPSSRTLYGLGGIGKTQIALEYAHRFRAEYDLVWWIDAEQPEAIAATLADLARDLGLPVGDGVGQAVDAALAALRRGEPVARWLLVFDNADDPADLLPYLPGGAGHVLVTSRNPGWGRVAEALPVTVFSRAESVAHLCRRVGGLTGADADAVAEAVGDLPLAVEVAAAWLAATGMPVGSYLDQLRGATARVLSLDRPVDYPASVAATWSVSIARLRQQSPAAVRLLHLCALMAPEPIAMRLLYGEATAAALARHHPAAGDPLAVADAIRLIGRYSLARVDAVRRTVQLHRLVQAVIRSALTEEEHRAAAHDVHLVLAGARPAGADVDDPANWPAFIEIWPHLSACDPRACHAPEARHLLLDRVRYLWKRGALAAAETLSGDLAPLWTRELGADHPQTLHLLFRRANVLRSFGRHHDALALDEDVLERRRATLGPHHPDTLTTAGSVGADHRVLGAFRTALALDLDTHRHLRDTLGPDDPRTLSMAHNLAIDHRLAGDSRTALDLDRDTLRRRTRVLGPRHPYTLSSQYCLARDLRDLGDVAGSLVLLAETTAHFDALPFPDLPDHLRTAASTAVSLRRAGRPAEALATAAGAHDRYLERFGADDLETLVCAAALAAAHGAVGDHTAARALTADIHRRYRRRLGEDHPFTLAAAANLALHLRAGGDPVGAVGHGEPVLAALGGALGDRHPFTVKARLNLANARAGAGRHHDALPLHLSALADLTELSGPDHPDTLTAAANLAATLRALGRTDEATARHARALAALADRLGEHHPCTDAVRRWEAVDQDLEPQPF